MTINTNLPHPLDKAGNIRFIKNNILVYLRKIIDQELDPVGGSFSDIDKAVGEFDAAIKELEEKLEQGIA